jgi:hypothetical protein
MEPFSVRLGAPGDVEAIARLIASMARTHSVHRSLPSTSGSKGSVRFSRRGATSTSWLRRAAKSSAN